MTQEEKELLLKDLGARLQYKLHCRVFKLNGDIKENDDVLYGIVGDNVVTLKSDKDECLMYYQIKPYLRSLSNMTEEEAMEVAELWGLEDILSISVKENYISVELCDGVAMSETYTIWFNEIVASIKLFDWLNSHHFDYRGLIGMCLAFEAPKDMYK